MKFQENFIPPPTEIEKAEKEIVPQSPEVKIEAEISNEELEQYATAAETQIEQQTAEILPEAEQKIESSAKSMNVSPETMGAVRQEQGLDVQLNEIQAEASQLANEARLGIGKITTQEADPEATAELMQESIRNTTEHLSKLSDEEAVLFIAEFNKNNPGSLKSQEFKLMRSSGEKIVMVDESGNLQEMLVTKENAKDVLGEIKTKDETLRGKSYELRQEILKRSGGDIATYEAYIYATDIPSGNDFDSFMSNPDNWLPERVVFHREILDKKIKESEALSIRRGMPPKQSKITTLRGNTASGKTTATAGNEKFSDILDEKKEATGAVNPDTYKVELINLDKVEGVATSNHSQTHEESSMLGKLIQKKIVENIPPQALVIDKRMDKDKNIKELLKIAHQTGVEVEICDIDVPLETSLIRVLGREAGGDSPLVAFQQVAEGFEGIRKNRTELLRTVNGDPQVTDYVLYAMDENGNSVETARKVNGKFEIVEGRKELFKKTLSKDTDTEINKMAETLIDETYIQDIINKTPEKHRPKVQASLERFKGKTFKEALDLHAKS